MSARVDSSAPEENRQNGNREWIFTLRQLTFALLIANVFGACETELKTSAAAVSRLWAIVGISDDFRLLRIVLKVGARCGRPMLWPRSAEVSPS
ncbi:hypothetical protein [Mycobacterium attenuatum]|uniref:hypothetical protein n=1 Tax=Mycobacterium attenuatum TaxID=2341086 RepID=UPI000F02173A|nr:hypothetical protein [Mycobacterium attenuatum]